MIEQFKEKINRIKYLRKGLKSARKQFSEWQIIRDKILKLEGEAIGFAQLAQQIIKDYAYIEPSSIRKQCKEIVELANKGGIL